LSHLLSRREHLAADEIFEGLRRSGTPVSIATLYQNLAALVARGLLRRFAGPDGVARYDDNLDAHHHLVCDGCGRIVDVEVPADARVRPVASRRRGRSPATGWQVRAAHVEFRGTCPACRA
jgi:Fe2+ or Zn2+ uptake regulation protein